MSSFLLTEITEGFIVFFLYTKFSRYSLSSSICLINLFLSHIIPLLPYRFLTTNIIMSEFFQQVNTSVISRFFNMLHYSTAIHQNALETALHPLSALISPCCRRLFYYLRSLFILKPDMEISFIQKDPFVKLLTPPALVNMLKLV